MAKVILKDVTKRFGEVEAVKAVSFEIREGEFVSLLGPSGCGKTTTLRIIAGLEEVDGGKVYLGGEDMTFVQVFKRNIGLMFQDYALFPHMTVEDNVAFGLKMRRLPKRDIREKVEHVLGIVGLQNLGRRMPHELSGGQQQRVALARTLVVQPRVLLLDEPLSNLDAKVRKEMRLEIRRIQKEMGITTILVTHDQEEALSVSDRVIIMQGGVIVEEGKPLNIYNRPQTEFVANFMGQTNVVRGTVSGDRGGLLMIKAGQEGVLSFRCAADRSWPEQTEVMFMIPREDLQICDDTVEAGDSLNIIQGVVQSSSYGGGHVQYQCLADGLLFTFSQTAQDESDIKEAGEPAKLCFSTSKLHILERSGMGVNRQGGETGCPEMI